jgi:hypothetical protein
MVLLLAECSAKCQRAGKKQWRKFAVAAVTAVTALVAEDVKALGNPPQRVEA